MTEIQWFAFGWFMGMATTTLAAWWVSRSLERLKDW
jgi:uncharacterized membrane protein YedE/YeeE